MLMKKPLRYMLSLVLMLALMLSMGTAAFADKTDSGLPVEYVTYGVGLPDAPGVDRHELGDDDITIDGVSWRTKTSEDKLYVYVLDLAAAKLLRSCADEAKELGLDLIVTDHHLPGGNRSRRGRQVRCRQRRGREAPGRGHGLRDRRRRSRRAGN